MAGRAVLGFVVFHRDFEHVVAADADTMDFRRRILARLGWRRLVVSLVRFRHGWILARRAKWGRGLRGLSFGKQFAHARDDFFDADRPVENGSLNLCGFGITRAGGGKRNLFRA